MLEIENNKIIYEDLDPGTVFNVDGTVFIKTSILTSGGNYYAIKLIDSDAAIIDKNTVINKVLGKTDDLVDISPDNVYVLVAVPQDVYESISDTETIDKNDFDTVKAIKNGITLDELIRNMRTSFAVNDMIDGIENCLKNRKL